MFWRNQRQKNSKLKFPKCNTFRGVNGVSSWLKLSRSGCTHEITTPERRVWFGTGTSVACGSGQGRTPRVVWDRDEPHVRFGTGRSTACGLGLGRASRVVWDRDERHWRDAGRVQFLSVVHLAFLALGAGRDTSTRITDSHGISS